MELLIKKVKQKDRNPSLHIVKLLLHLCFLKKKQEISLTVLKYLTLKKSYLEQVLKSHLVPTEKWFLKVFNYSIEYIINLSNFKKC